MSRPSIGAPRMRRMHFLQQWYALADEALEDTLYDSQAMSEVIGIDLWRANVPHATARFT